MSMFCYQCEQTAKGTGCTAHGVCGKSPEASRLMDLLVYGCKGISMYAHRAGEMGMRERDLGVFVVETLFMTVTNVNFDKGVLYQHLMKLGKMMDKAKELYESACKTKCVKPKDVGVPAAWRPKGTIDELVRDAESIDIPHRKSELGDDITGLEELLTYGLKGMSAYADHAHILGKEDESVYDYIFEALDFLTRKNLTADELVGMNLKCGEINLKVMEMLDSANRGAYGNPEPTKVRVTPVKGKAIVVSGHDLKDLEELLKQAEGRGVNVYTHGEMLPCHGYPELKKYKHLAGNYGSAWQNQQKEFAAFPGAILMTTNCIQMPQKSYEDRIFTCGLVGWPGTTHINDRDFTPVIEAALKADGFKEDGEEKYITVGFGHNAVLNVADKIIDYVKSGKIKHFFLIGGCDGAKPGRNYYTEFAEKVPADCIILTLACGKYRFNKLEFGDIDGIPRLIDCGQCNDAYSAIKIASALADAFSCSVNDLPLSMILSWYEQKAVCILLTLLHLGIKNMKLGPTLPAFVTPNVLGVLIEKFNIMPIKTVDGDLDEILS